MAVTSVNDTNASTALLAPSPHIKGCSIYNASSAILYVLQGNGTASVAAGGYSFQMAAGDYWESPSAEYVRGGLAGIWASDSTGYAQITTW